MFLLLMMTPQLAGVGVVYAANRSGRRELRSFAPVITAFTFVVTSLWLWGASVLNGRAYGASGILAVATVLGVLMHWTISSAALAGVAAPRRAGQPRARVDGAS